MSDKNILVIEDSEVEGLYLRRIAEKIDNTSVTLVRNYEDACKLCTTEKYDLVLVDAIVPKGEAKDFLTEMKRTELNKNTNAVIMGSPSDFKEKGVAKSTGFVNYIEKPVEFNVLKAVITMYA